MVPGPSFYIHGGGRWREVDVSSGRIDGWGRARFVYTRRGIVHLAKSKRVLSALRDLKVGRKGAVSDGIRLPFKKLELPNNHRDNQADICECNYSHCCQKFSHNRCPAKNTINQSVPQKSLEIRVLPKSDAAIQASLPDSNKKSDKTVNKSAGSDDDIPSKITTALVNSSPNKLAKLKLKKQWSIAGSHKPQNENSPSLKLNKTDASKYIFYKRKRTGSESSTWVVMPKTDTKLVNNAKDHAYKSKYLEKQSQSTSLHTSQDSRMQKVVKTKSIVGMKPKPQDMKTNDSYADAKSKLKRRRLSSTSQSSIESQPQKIDRRTKSIVVESKSQNGKNNDYADAKSKQLKKRRHSISSNSSQESVPQKIERRTKSVADSYPRNHVTKMKYAPKPIKDQDKVTEKHVTSSEDNKSNTKNNEETKADNNKFMELCIEEEDVEVLRNYLLHNASDFDLLKFDSSNEYKIKFLYSINPVVNLEMCPMIARMLQNDRRDSQSEISLKDFVSQLGLTSVTEKKVPQRYKLRKRNSDKDTDRSENESEIENKVNKAVVQHSIRKRQTISTELETDIDSEEDRDITIENGSKVDQAPKPRRYTRSQSTGDSKGNNRQSDTTEKISSNRIASKSDGDYTDEDTSIEKAKTKTKPKRNTRNQLINQAEDKKDNNRKSCVKETSAKLIMTKSDGDFTDDDSSMKEAKTKTNPKRNTRNQLINQSEDKKDNNRKNDVKETSAKRKMSKSDGNFTDDNSATKEAKTKTNLKRNTRSDTKGTNEDSSVKEDKTRVLRKRRSISNVDVTIVSDSEEFQKSSNRSQNRKINNSIKKSEVNTMDLTNSSNDDSEWITDTEEMDQNQKAKHDKRNNIEIKERRKSVNKIDTRQSDKQNKEYVNTQNTKSSRQRNSRGQYLGFSKIAMYNTNDSVDVNSKTVDKNSKTTRKSDKNVTNTINKSQTAESSEDIFKSKSKDKTQNKLNKTKDETKKDNSNKINILQSEEDSADEFETNQREKSKKRNRNISKENDRNNNMTDNDELSETDSSVLVKQTKTRNNKPKPNKVANTNDNSIEEQSESSKKKASECILGNKNMDLNKDHQVFFAPRIEEVKSLSGMTKESRPSSSASSKLRVKYSSMEDHAIVSWIRLGGRACCVKGNRIWRELQDSYQNLTGQFRTWHSLRNRYLRSILPRLGSMALNPSLVTRLRAAAATGEIKPQKGPPRRNSIFGAPVVGALSRKVRARSSSTEEELPAKRHKHDHTRKQPPPSTRKLRSTQEFSPVKPLSSPRYSEITRNFAQKHRKSTPYSSEIENTEETSLETKKADKTSLESNKSENLSLETKKSENLSLETKKSVKKLLKVKNNSETSTDSESLAKNSPVLRSRRQISNDSSTSELLQTKSSKNRSPEKMLPQTAMPRKSIRNLSLLKATEKLPARGQPRTRKLFNPNSMI